MKTKIWIILLLSMASVELLLEKEFIAFFLNIALFLLIITSFDFSKFENKLEILKSSLKDNNDLKESLVRSFQINKEEDIEQELLNLKIKDNKKSLLISLIEMKENKRIDYLELYLNRNNLNFMRYLFYAIFILFVEVLITFFPYYNFIKDTYIYLLYVYEVLMIYSTINDLYLRDGRFKLNLEDFFVKFYLDSYIKDPKENFEDLLSSFNTKRIKLIGQLKDDIEKQDLSEYRTRNSRRRMLETIYFHVIKNTDISFNNLKEVYEDNILKKSLFIKTFDEYGPIIFIGIIFIIGILK